MKAALLVSGLMLVLANPAQASWAENAQKANPVYTGTNASLAKAQGMRARGHTIRRVHRPHSIYRDEYRTYR